MQGVIFDFNGTLIFDDDINSEAWYVYSEKLTGKRMSLEEYHLLNGRPGEYWIKHLKGEDTSEEECHKCSEEKEGVYRDLLLKSDKELAPGAIELFEDLIKNKIPITIATSSNYLNVQAYFQKFGLAKYFGEFDDNTIVTFFDGSFKGKPAPDIYLKAAKKIGVDITKCIVFEDTKSGVKSASSAGAKVIGMASGKSVEEVWKFDTVVDVVKDYKGLDTEKLKKYFE